MVQLPSWGRLLVLIVVALGLFAAVPNFWPRTTQVSLIDLPVLGWLDGEGAEIGAEVFTDQARLQELLKDKPAYEFLGDLPGEYQVGPAPDGAHSVILLSGATLPLVNSRAAQDCKVRLPFFCRQINLGLDLQGGVFAALQLDEIDYWTDRFERARTEIETLKDTGEERFAGLWLSDMELIDEGDEGLYALFNVQGGIGVRDIRLAYEGASDIFVNETDDGLLELRVSGQQRERTLNSLTSRLLESLRLRFDAFGISEPIIREAGPAGRVFVELPGASAMPDIPVGALELCSAPANFTNAAGPEYRFLDAQTPGSIDVQGASRIAIDRTVPCVVTEDIVSASPSLEGANVQVNVRLRPGAGTIMNNLTREEWAGGRRYLATILDDKVVRLDSFEPNLSTSFRIRGIGNQEEATTLSIILRAGALPAKVTILEQSKVGPELGASAVQAGRIAAILAVLAVLAYMVISYGLFGLFANIALIVNLGLILGIMSLLGFTLSLPGIAGIVLTIGMAVDANVLVFERMREVWRKTENVGQAIENGYAQALSTILDANITTLIAATVLFFIGKGAIQGFSVTLGIGILTSIFTALLFTRMLIGFWFTTGRRLTMPI